jgi:hypothetical protein
MSDKSRRKLLKSIAAGSGAIVAGKSLPESWSKPVVDSVLLPAHAQTSPAVQTYFGPAIVIEGQELMGGANDVDVENTILADVTDKLIPAAHAGGPEGETNGTLCITVNGNSADVAYQNDANSVLRRATLATSGFPGFLEFAGISSDESCSKKNPRNLPAEITEVNSSYVELEIEHRGTEGNYLVLYRVYAAPGCALPPLVGVCDR